MNTAPRVDIPIACPVCGLAAVERIFRDFTMTVIGPEEDKTVRGLAAYICKVNGHVFFIRHSDLPIDRPTLLHHAPRPSAH